MVNFSRLFSFIIFHKCGSLLLCSGQDNLLPSREEGERLSLLLPKCDIRIFNDCGHALFLVCL